MLSRVFASSRFACLIDWVLFVIIIIILNSFIRSLILIVVASCPSLLVYQITIFTDCWFESFVIRMTKYLCFLLFNKLKFWFFLWPMCSVLFGCSRLIYNVIILNSHNIIDPNVMAAHRSLLGTSAADKWLEFCN